MYNLKCFLASNSAKGFVSRFGECYLPEEGWQVYIIKGGPGTGKSSFMKRVVQSLKGSEAVVEAYCASDPDSLDGVILPESRRAFMDGTSPHVVEPRLPGVCENLLDFGRFWDAEALRQKSAEIISATAENKACHHRAAEYIKNAGRLFPEDFSREGAGAELIAKHIPEKGGSGRMLHAFLGGVTPLGVEYFTKSVSARTTVISGGRDADGIIKNIANAAKMRGFDGFVFENPILPHLTDGVFIPELSFFAVKDCFIPQSSEIDRLLAQASSEIAKAKEIHDLLEGFYISAMDYAAVDRFIWKFLSTKF
jgi:hypothetical protein